MVRSIPFQTNSRLYENYYVDQAGHGLPVFVGGRNYRGAGLGNVLAGIGRVIMPLIKKGGKAILNEGLRTGANVVQDLIAGRNVKTALKRRAEESGKRLFNNALNNVKGAVFQPTTPKRIKKSPKNKRRQKTRKRRSVKDIFG